MALGNCKHCQRWQPTGNYTRKHRRLGWCSFLEDLVPEDKFCFNFKAKKGGGSCQKESTPL